MPSPSVNLEYIHVPVWALRLALDFRFGPQLVRDPGAFIHWYGVCSSLVEWPSGVVDAINAIRHAALPPEQMHEALAEAGIVVRGQASDDALKSMMAGMEVWDWTQREPGSFEQLTTQLKLQLANLESATTQRARHSRTAKLAEALEFSPLEQRLLSLALSHSKVSEVIAICERLLSPWPDAAPDMWATMLGISRAELEGALAPDTALARSRLIGRDPRTGRLGISDFWAELLLDPPGAALLDGLVKPLVSKGGSGLPARLSPADADLVVQMLKCDTEDGVNVLLHGSDSLDRTEQLLEVLSRGDCQGFVLDEDAGGPEDLPAMVYVVQRALFAEYGASAVLVVERPKDVLEQRVGPRLTKLFGFEKAGSPASQTFAEMLLTSNPAPTVWCGPGGKRLTPDSVGRFVLHAPLKKANREERRAHLEKYLTGLTVSESTMSALLGMEGVSASQLDTAHRAALLVGLSEPAEQEAFLVQTVRRGLEVLGYGAQAAAKECVTEYKLDYLNHSGRFGPEQLLKAFKVRPKGTLCLYGPPGTGKTQFVEHLAQSLGLPLVAKRASDLLSKYVGDNEQNIAAMFSEAQESGAVLFLDEGDTFLRERSHARSQWEVSMVNELLQQMERFPGIFIVATNLFEGLDAAALRRFTFKLELQALNPEQRWRMFVQEAGVPEAVLAPATCQEWFEELASMRRLSVGDFATVQRQCQLLGEVLTPEQWLEQLGLECAVKPPSSRDDGHPRLASG